MKEWRTPEQEDEDRLSRRSLKNESWSIGIVMAALLLLMARELFGW